VEHTLNVDGTQTRCAQRSGQAGEISSAFEITHRTSSRLEAYSERDVFRTRDPNQIEDLAHHVLQSRGTPRRDQAVGSGSTNQPSGARNGAQRGVAQIPRLVCQSTRIAMRRDHR